MTQFKNSELYKSIESSKHSKQRLTNIRPYVEKAVSFWKERDMAQFVFFRDADHLIIKYLLKLN